MNFVIRDDDLNFFSDPELVQQWYGAVFDQKIPVSFATIPFVIPFHPMLDRGQGFTTDREYLIRANSRLVDYVKNNPFMEIMLHGCNHELPNGDFEYGQASGLFEKTIRGKNELEQVFGKPITVFVAPHDQFSSHAILAIEHAKLNILRGKGSKNFLWRIEYFIAIIKMIIHKTISPFAFPKVIDLGAHQEAFGSRIEFGREHLFKALNYAHEHGGDFILVNHIHDFDENKKQLMLELISEARKLGTVFIPASKLFKS